MKKTYSKPDIMFDNFSMTTCIAACEVEATFSRGVCGVEMDNMATVFTESVYGCTWVAEDGDASFDFLCYHVPSDNNNVFGS